MGARRAMVLNHEQDAPPVRTLLNKMCFTKRLFFMCGRITERLDLHAFYIIQSCLYTYPRNTSRTHLR